ncbi:S-layer homology domain-containing protein [Argonema galeatum]|uniref:S-layer homology domain-containing protein n=1 Tax=Argonema galeatum TaxID=2942762 RepID=UPI0020116747|nr:S-layer homology domain-containing protein [Argonema galeatum]MCL1464763.1 S-layer homology domain-containing protein [Argonema galeatum A003/A1]
MNQSFLALLGKIVFATASLAICATVSASTLEASQQLLAAQPARRQARQNNELVPEVIANAVLQNLSQQTGIQTSGLRIIEAQQETWTDGCLGIANPGIVCSKAMVPGWRVVVGRDRDRQRWVYRTNLTGSLVKLDPTASQNVAATSPPPSPPSPPTRLSPPPARRQATATTSRESTREPLPQVVIDQDEAANPENQRPPLIEEPLGVRTEVRPPQAPAIRRTEVVTAPQEPAIRRTEVVTAPQEPVIRRTEIFTAPQEPAIRRTEVVTPPQEPVTPVPQVSSTVVTPPRRTLQLPPRQVSMEGKSSFSLAIRQPSATLSDVVARVSLKPKNGNSYAPEQLIGDYRYRLDRRAIFTGGMNTGDRIVLRLYDSGNRLIGFTELELLAQNTAVNLIFPEQASLYRMVRTLYGIDADRDGSIDQGTNFYDYYTIITGTRAGEERVSFLNGVPNTSLTWFQVAGLPVPSRTSVYPNSFNGGEQAITNQAISVFRPDLPRVFTTVPGKGGAVTNVNNNSSYNATRLSGTTRSPEPQAPTPTPEVQANFADIPSNHWARSFIAQLVAKEILEGFPDGLYRPNAPVTRAEFASILRKAFDRNKVRDVVAFRDVPTNHWAYPAIQEAYEMGFLETNSSQGFSPDQKVSRLDVLVALGRGLNYSPTRGADRILSVYRDAAAIPKSDRDLIAAVTERDMVVSYPNVNFLNGDRLATRAEVAALIYRALVSIGKAEEIVSPYVVVSAPDPTNTEVRERPRSNRQRPATRSRRQSSNSNN